uniref:ADP-ribosyl cyclase/cyclic ADP-ribose hydrolase n=1 Tax=Populus trichocarpa TaxID=3694 RepID=Q19PM7_POPTR|nr:TIR-NBS-LRR-TIR type disease resistance protein [Populus trichocarpa]
MAIWVGVKERSCCNDDRGASSLVKVSDKCKKKIRKKIIGNLPVRVLDLKKPETIRSHWNKKKEKGFGSCFRGKDTRNNFTSHLYSNLAQRGIDVFMDDRELERGKTIEPALWKAIEESRFSVIIFSRDYASSPWCLDELVKIVQCMKEMGHTVLPVFYDVDPSETYEKAFVEHEQNFKENLEKVRIWKDCLSTVTNLSGWDVRNRNESESIKIIVEYISYKLSITLPTISKNLVGIDSRLEVLNGYIGEEVGEAIFIGICGMGGLGKTTVARVVYDRIRWQFEGSCFLANVREVFAEKDGPRRLQEQLLSEILMERASVCDSSRGIEMIKRRSQRKKILVVLDDVDDHKQLESLAAESKWFGPGSRIIITSRDKQVLTRNGVARIYEAEKLNDDDALMLFSQKAFENDQPAEDFLDLSKQVVGYANGLPLALEVIGSFLHGRSIPEWRGAINRMNEIPDHEIIKVLLVSFDGLHELEKKIFLDIACFLKGFKIDRITRILDGRGFHASIGIPVLIERSLISVSRDQVWMHNLLQKMGKEIIRRESPEEPGRRSRLWTYKDVCLALMDNIGKEKIEAIFLDMPGIKEAQWNMEAFSKMSRLRLLKINNVQLSEGPEDLSNKLRFLEWHSYPSKSLPASLQVDELVELHMANSSIEQLWYGCKSAINLKIINLSNSLNLSKTPNLTGIPNLESLILEGCTSLSEVHPSLALHKKLQHVNLVNCKSIRILPNNLEMESLKVCTLDGCSKLEKFPDIIGNMNCLMVLRLDETSITKLPSSIHHLIGLGLLSMNSCKNLESIPSSIGCLKSLKKLDLSGCSELKCIPENLGKVESLEEFDGLSNPRPGFGIAVPGNEIPGWFNHRSKGSSISVQVPSGRMGFFACVAFNANDESPSLFCHFKANGRENYPSPMCINFEGHLFSDHIWLFYLSFDYLKELQEWQHESFSNIELSFHSYEQGVKVNNCGVCLLSSLYIIVTGKEATSSYKDSLAFSSSCHEWMANVFPVTYLNSDLALVFIIPIEKEPEKVMAIRSKLFEAIEESGMPIIIFSRDCASLLWCHDELVRIAGFMDEIKSDTVFPVSHYVDQSKMDDQTESYTIVFYKNEENLRENEEKGQRWKDILTKVEISSGSKSGEGAPATQQQQIQLHLHQQRIQHLQLVKQWQGVLQKREHLSEQQREEHLELQEQWRQQQLLERQQQQLLERQQQQLGLQQLLGLPQRQLLDLRQRRLLERQRRQLHRQQWQLHRQMELPLLRRQQQHEQQPHQQQQLLLEQLQQQLPWVWFGI